MNRSTPAHAPDNTRPATSHRRLCLAMLIAFAIYAGLLAVAHVVGMRLAGRSFDVIPNRVTEIYWSMRIHGILAALATAAVFILRRRQGCAPRTTRITLVTVTVCTLLSLDRIAGIVYPPPSEINSVLAPHPTRGWALRRGIIGSGAAVRVAINNLGMRGPDIPRRKAPDEFRILFLGDSITFGYFLEYNDTFVTQTGTRLRGMLPGRRITDLNAGVGAYTTWQELDYLKNEGLYLEPDLVILEYCFNDVADLVDLDPDMISGAGPRFEFSNERHWSGFVRAAMSIYGRYRFDATMASLRFADNIPTERSDPRNAVIEDLFNDDAGPEAREALNRSFGFLDQVDELCRANKLPWALVAFPSRSQLETDAPDVRLQKKLAQWADRRGVRFFDLLPAFRRQVTEKGRKPWDLMVDIAHPTAEGSRLITDELVRFLTRENLVPKARADNTDRTGM